MAELYQLRCRECGKFWGNTPKSFCEECFSPLEVAFDYDALVKIYNGSAVLATSPFPDATRGHVAVPGIYRQDLAKAKEFLVRFDQAFGRE